MKDELKKLLRDATEHPDDIGKMARFMGAIDPDPSNRGPVKVRLIVCYCKPGEWPCECGDRRINRRRNR